MEAKPRVVAQRIDKEPRFGFTVTKAMGGAVTRNRIRRRLKAAVTAVAPSGAKVDTDYVIIARPSALDRPFEQLKKDLEHAFHRVHHPVRTKPRGRSGTNERA